jgi:hypothetical protein
VSVPVGAAGYPSIAGETSTPGAALTGLKVLAGDYGSETRARIPKFPGAPAESTVVNVTPSEEK